MSSERHSAATQVRFEDIRSLNFHLCGYLNFRDRLSALLWFLF